jgi:hypothetical protein
LTDDQKKELRRREILTYKRKNSSAPPSQTNTLLPSAEKVAPPPVCEFLPKLTPTDDIQLNIYVANMFGKLNMAFPVTEMCKIPFVKKGNFEYITGANREGGSSHHFKYYVSRSTKRQEPSLLPFIRHEWPPLEQLHA